MEVFGTTITAGTLIIKFLSACAAYSSDAKSLRVHFERDIRALQNIEAYFEQRKAQSPNQHLSDKDNALLNQTAEYMSILRDKTLRSLRKIQRQGFLGDAFNRVTWIARREDLKELHQELNSWAQSFGIRIAVLPPELRTLIPTVADVDTPATAVVRSHDRLQDFLRLAQKDQEIRAKSMLLQNTSELEKQIAGRPDISYIPVQVGPEELVLASRRVSETTAQDEAALKKLESDMGLLAAALSCLDPAADLRLLKVEYYFYHADSRQFLFAHASPFPTMSMMTLETLISDDPFPGTEAPLDRRLHLAQKLAEAVFFLHSAKFLHKNITSSSVVTLQKPEESTSPLENAYLMGFELIRGVDARTTKEGAVKEADELPRSIWEFDIYQHPDRLQGERSPKYTKVYDVYSLGVVLLEIGLWQPIYTVGEGTMGEDRSVWADRLLHYAVPSLSSSIGERYKRLVAWCLSLKGDDGFRDTDFLEMVLDPLEDMTMAMS